VNKVREVDTSSAVSKSFYVFLVISIISAAITLVAGLLMSSYFYKFNNFYPKVATAIYFSPLLISCVGILSGAIANIAVKNNESSPADGCAVNVSIFFNVFVSVAYIVLLMIALSIMAFTD
jgi:hypothetical protein